MSVDIIFKKWTKEWHFQNFSVGILYTFSMGKWIETQKVNCIIRSYLYDQKVKEYGEFILTIFE